MLSLIIYIFLLLINNQIKNQDLTSVLTLLYPIIPIFIFLDCQRIFYIYKQLKQGL